MSENTCRCFLVSAMAEWRMQMEERLRPLGTVSGHAASAQLAVEALRQSRPDLVFVDIALGGDDGIDLAARIVGELGLRVVLAGAVGETDMRRVVQAGVADILPHDPSPIEIQNVLTRLSGATGSVRGQVLTVFSTKGGVGKTTIACNLAIALADRGSARVALVDLDLEFGNVATLFGLKPERTIVDLCRRSGALSPLLLEEVLCQRSGISVAILAAPPTPDQAAVVDGEGRRDAARNYVAEILALLRQNFDWIVIDTAADFSGAVITALDESQTVLMLTSPDVPALQNTAKGLDILLERLSYPTDKVRVVLNRANSAIGLTEEDIARVLDFPISFRVPSDGEAAVWSANTGEPVLRRRGRSLLARAIVGMAGQIMDPGGKGRTIHFGGR